MAQLGKFAGEFTKAMEVIIVVEKSSDGTLEIAKELVPQQADSAGQFRVIGNEVQRGKGYAVRTGMLEARGEYVFYLDADLSVPLAEVHTFLQHFEENPEIAVLVGNRQHAAARITRAQSWVRRTMGQTFNRILGAMTLARLPDTQCGFKAFRQAAAKAIFERQRIDGFAFDVEVLVLAQRLGLPMADLPVEWMNSPESKVRIVRDSLRMLADAARIRRLVDRTMSRLPAGRSRVEP